MKSLKIVLYSVLVIGLVTVGLAMTATPAAAAVAGDQGLCEGIDFGTWVGADPATGDCIGAGGNVLNYIGCPEGSVSMDYTAVNGFIVSHTCYFSANGAPLNYGMERKGICKLVSVEDAFLGGYITATVKGAPNFLRLKVNGTVYKLPVVPGTVTANGDNTSTAQFYTRDPQTGQPLVPAGDYQVRCFGTAGTNDGAGFTITLGY